MNSRFQAKSDLYVFFGYVVTAIALAFNPITLPFWQQAGLIPTVPSQFMHAHDVMIALPLFADGILLLLGMMMVWAPRYLSWYFNKKLWFNFLLFVLLLGVQFSTNPVLPGKYKLLRILLVLTALFFLTNSLYLGVVREHERRHIQPFFRNLAVAGFSVLFVLALLEVVFMFVMGTHRFNGTLASRAWFMHNWHLNAEGYRDEEYSAKKATGKKNVLVLGDSFVAGHGVKDPKKRFSDLLAAKLPEDFQVFNLGVGGSDVRDAYERLRHFPYKPDILIFSYYPNDIEQDGERGGLRLQRAHSYDDVGFPFRYFIRRSYLLNYIYWRFPHPSELSDYKGYIRQCHRHPGVQMLHFSALDKLIGYADSLDVPMATVVFPFLEDAPGSEFATAPVLARMGAQGVPSLDVRAWLLGKDPIDYIVNRNDPHPNEALHAMVADSLFRVLSQEGYLHRE